jgi:hypothetical protein
MDVQEIVSQERQAGDSDMPRVWRRWLLEVQGWLAGVHSLRSQITVKLGYNGLSASGGAATNG